ncbi:uncharacterized skeletal organic matrix protein 5-like [Acropora millepora]|uniref:uncharacterized skeletal organic matrix protein 5-like n=1 Tax=Acropora millepora TaxID=45264 RepID=UPI001CF29B70|nr:uncharacterized skeletal organic matrix protein 5-like [Acropora millepora]
MSVTIFAFYLMSLVSTSEATGEQCKVYQVPIHGKALRGHNYKTAKAGELFRCYVRCERDPACLSCNFKHAQEICEMNNETKETKPNDFITDEESYYIKRTGGAVTASSCNEIFQKQRRTKSQVYTLMLGSQDIPVYCFMGDFGCGSGGWTLVMKTDGTKNTFNYSSPFWSNKKEYNLAGGKTGFDKQETKLPSYWATQFSKICLGMSNGSTTSFVVIHQSANSLYELVADGTYRSVSVGRNKWKSLIGPQASLQTYCNKEGFNVVSGDNFGSEARIGIIANNENNCSSCDSRIGYGTGGYSDDVNTCGNEAKHGADNGDKQIKAMGYILVQ